MANISPAFVQVHPSYMMPDTLMPYSQASGAFELLASGAPLIRLADGDLYAYIKRVDLRTRMAAGQSAYNQLPGVNFALSQISAPTYLLRVRAEYDHHALCWNQKVRGRSSRDPQISRIPIERR